MKDLQDIFDNLAPQRFYTHTEDSKAKMRAASKNKTAEYRDKLSAVQKTSWAQGKNLGRLGHKNSEQAKAKVAQARSKAVVIPNGGKFDSIGAAAKWACANGLAATEANARRKIEQYIVKYPEHYYFVKELP
tara:strand:- start:5155 stop:5550 length:396 start_codon:yes stop_codon:yes gene_type:complete